MRSCFILLIAALLIAHNGAAQSQRNWLAGSFSPEEVSASINIGNLNRQFPEYKNRARWESIDPVYKKKLIEDGESALNYNWQTVPATVYLEYIKTGNRYLMEDLYNMNLAAIKKLAFAELAEGKARFIPQLINGVWAVSEISSWSISASLNLQRAGAGLPDVNEPVIELGAGITVNVLAWTYHLFKDEFDKESKLVTARLRQEINRRILEPYYTRNDFWWMALDGKQRMVNNWNVWLNYNMLTTILLVEENAEKRKNGIYKTMRSVDQFINYYKEDGACEEGPAYWSHAGGMLFNYLSLLQLATDGKVNIFSKPLIRNIGNYICKAYIDSSWYLNYADASARIKADASLIWHFGKAVQDTGMQQFGAWLAKDQHWEKSVPVDNMYGGFRNLFTATEILESKAQQPFLAAAWMKETGIAVARDQEGSGKGFYFSALGGHNDESHNHNDVGTCVLYYNGQPLLIDLGNETYNKKTFGPERYSIWTMRSAYHNVPLINGVEQKEGKQYAAKQVSFENKKKTAVFKADIAAAYPETAGVSKWERVYTLKRGQSFTISDNYTLRTNKGNTALYFLTSASPGLVKPGLLQFKAGDEKIFMDFNPGQFELVIEPIPITDKKLLESWPPLIHRLVFKLRPGHTKASHHIVFRKPS
ncbi:MAG: heparinase II/III domain-containing protein [Pseudobacter sp.]|uniref:heparinase II/III domain-containing protein n=1 Tax=Pseudobacter sp. TaxID=2045420 RepID=UPI003F813FBD